MSAAVAFVNRLDRSAHLLTDGASFDTRGRIKGNYVKAKLLPHLNAAFTVRGPIAVAHAFELEVGRFDRFEHLAENLGAVLKAAVRRVWLRVPIPQAFLPFRLDFSDVVLVGSPPNGPQVIYACGHKFGRDAVEPWTAVPIAGGALRFASPMSDEMERGICAPLITGGHCDPQHDGLELMRAQRLVPNDLPGAKDSHSRVGLFCHLTSITPFGITTRILERWPDEVGRPVESAAS